MAAKKTPAKHVVKLLSTRHYRHGHGGAYDTNKDRTQWFFQRSAFPLRDAPPLALERFWRNQENFPHVHDVTWEEAGPTNFAGRVTCLAIDPKNPQTLFAGAAAGGVWKSTDGGATWKTCWPTLLNQNIGALAIHPRDGNQLYCATGEGNLSADSYPGSGIYQTADGGMTWIPVFTATSGGSLSEEASSELPRRVGTIAFGRMSKNDYRIALGAVSNDESLAAALYMDEGGFGLQPNTFWGIRSYNCYAVVFHPVKEGVVYVSIQPRGTLNGIWRSDNFGKSWRHLTRGMPAPETCGRIGLAISPSHPDIMYALASGLTSRVRGVLRSSDGGETWHEIGGSHFAHESQMSYNNTIAVHPEHPNYVVCGGTNLHQTTNGGKRWKQITTGQRGDAGDRFPRNFVHNDHHALAITRHGVIYSGNDGGVAMSEDGGKTWQPRGHGMATTMYYAADVAQTNSAIFGGGTQDNGTLLAGVPDRLGGKVPPLTEFTRVLPSDGGWIEIDPADEEHIFGSTANLIIARHRRGEPWAHGRQLAPWADISIPEKALLPGEKGQRAFAAMAIEPGAHKGRKKVWAGTSRLWQTDNSGLTWWPVSPSFDDSAISAIECAPADPQVMYVGTSAGGFFRSIDGGATWSASLASSVIPRRMITSIVSHPLSATTVVLSVASSGVPGTSLRRIEEGGEIPSQSAYSHVFQSGNSGNTWGALDGGDLPDVVYNALAFETHPPFRLFVAGDAGVWMSLNPDTRKIPAASCWASIAGNMPNVVVSALIYHHKDRILTAATYGRAFWRLKLAGPLEVIDPRSERVPKDAPLAVGLRRDASVPAPVLLAPADGAQFSNTSPTLTVLTWEPVSGAIGYTVDVTEESGFSLSLSSRRPAVKFVSDSGIARWRVWALLPQSARSPGSEVRTFRYLD
jgi:photosystem II stability/assembly factor-like uncharacterized protein